MRQTLPITKRNSPNILNPLVGYKPNSVVFFLSRYDKRVIPGKANA